MDATNNAPETKPSSPRFVKTNIPNLIKLHPIGTYYGRCKVHGKLVRQSLDTKDFKVAKTKVRPEGGPGLPLLGEGRGTG